MACLMGDAKMVPEKIGGKRADGAGDQWFKERQGEGMR